MTICENAGGSVGPMDSASALDNPVWSSAGGPLAESFLRRGAAVVLDREVSPFVGLPTSPTSKDWSDLAVLLGAGGSGLFAADLLDAPAGWTPIAQVPGVQLVAETLRTAPEPEAVPLGPDDVPEMLDLVARTEPGPFLPRTIELGSYLGIRIDGALAAMAGERLRPPGWTEISAVCTDERFRGLGLATRLIRAVAHGIEQRGELPMLHTGAGNALAIALYERLGFRLRRKLYFQSFQAPSALNDDAGAVAG